MANPVTCISCGKECVKVSTADLCIECYRNKFDAWHVDLMSAMAQWISNTPPPVLICVQCGKDITPSFLGSATSAIPICDKCFDYREYRERVFPECVYFASDDKYIKIGRTKDLKTRMVTLKTKPLAFLTIRDSRSAERFFHDLFSDYMVKREWFDIPLDLIEWILGLSSDGMTITDNMSRVIWSVNDVR